MINVIQRRIRQTQKEEELKINFRSAKVQVGAGSSLTMSQSVSL